MKNVLLFMILPFMMKAQETIHPKDSSLLKQTSVNTSSKNKARKLIESYRQRVIKGESMASLAKLYSEDRGSAKYGGKYEHIRPGKMVPEFDKVAFSLKPGEISEIFVTEFGYHFIQLISRTGETINFRHILVTHK
jgi:peptidyl-prolyl cis-trans isomerase SurA